MVYGLAGQIVSTIMGFIVRTMFIYTLGAEYLGIDGLFTSVLLVLSLTNLGLDTAMIYSLYKPLADDDRLKVTMLMNMFKKIYRIIGIAVLIIGLAFLPFLSVIIKGNPDIAHLEIIYLLFVLNSSSSYFFIYKQSLIIADQKHYIISKFHMFFTFLSNLFQIVLLLAVKVYIAVLVFQILFRFLENYYIAKKTNELYPYINDPVSKTLTKTEKKLFLQDLYPLFLYKISGVVINASDNIIISGFIGLRTVGVLSNYMMILGVAGTFLSHIFFSVKASVGNLFVKESSEKNHFIFRVIFFTNFWLFGLSAILLWNTVNPVIAIWFGKEYLLSEFAVLMLLLNFFTAGMQGASTTFREATGLFKKGKYRPIFAAILNIVFSLLLVVPLGVAGVFLGTVISRLCVYFWYDPYIIFKYAFQQSAWPYFKRYVLYSCTVFICGIITHAFSSMLQMKEAGYLLSAGLISLAVTAGVFYLLFRNTEEFLYVKQIVKPALKRLLGPRMGKRGAVKAIPPK